MAIRNKGKLQSNSHLHKSQAHLGAATELTDTSTSASNLFSCLAPASASGWTFTPNFTTITCSGNTFVGGFGSGGSIETTYNISETHQGVVVSFKLALIDSWDNETFYVTADGNKVFSLTYDFLDSLSDTCGSFWEDRYVDVKFGFNHTDSTVDLVFTSDLNETSDNEAWGLCDLNLNFTSSYVDANGKRIGSINPFTFSCISQQMDPDWTYEPAYSTVTCNGNTYVGGFGSGGSMSANLTIPDAHNGIIMRFKLALLDSWEGETFTVTADGSIVYSFTYNYSDSTSDTCQNSWSDSYQQVSLGFNHTSDSVALVFSSNLDEESSNEAWGLCDLFIQTSTKVVDSSGYPLGGLTTPSDFTCSGNAKSIYWVYVPSFSTFTCNGYELVGPYGAGGSMSTYLRVAQEHKGIIFSLTLALIDSWEGETFTIKADGVVVYEYTHSASPAASNTCQEAWGDTYVDLRFGFNHSSEMIHFELSSSLDQEASDEAWGICGISFSPNFNYVDSHGFPLGEIKPLLFGCQGPAYDSTWTYVPAYSTVNCTSDSFLGGYGAGGSISTTLFLLDIHLGVIISFRLALFDNWQGETFTVTADGYMVYTYTHESNDSSADLCGASWGDTFIDVKFGMNHSSDWLHLNFSSSLSDDSDASWGICNLVTDPTYGTVHEYGYEFGSLKSVQFKCESPASDPDWVYIPAYTTVTCSGSTYVGGFGSGGNIFTILETTTPHHGIVITFKLLFTGTWEEDDFFMVLADDALVYSTQYLYNETSANSCQEGSQTSSATVTFSFNHTSGWLKLLLTSNLAQTGNDEASWAVCDLTFDPVVGYVDHSGNEYGAVRSLTFSCLKPTIDTEWTYNPFYSTVTCTNNNTFVGGFSSNGALNTTLAIHQLHDGLVISFKLALFDSWSNEDTFSVTIDEKTAYTMQYESEDIDICEEEDDESSVTCEGASKTEFIDVRFGINHTATSISMYFSSNLSKNTTSWGICDLSIETKAGLVDSDGNELTFVIQTF